jgi:PAS domain S-box-containing protein
MNSRIYKSFLILLILHLSLLSACRKYYSERISPEAVSGVLDLTDWDFEKDGPVDLKGEWEFYWQQHLSPDDLSKPTPPGKTDFKHVPEYWNNYEIDGMKLPGEGFATYRLTVFLDDPKQPLALRLMEISTAYTLFVNGKNLTSAGVTGTRRDTTTPQQYRQVVDFEPDADQLEIILHVSNFHHRKGGVWEVSQLGREADIRQSQERKLGFDLFLFGSIVIMGLYHLGLFVVRRKDRSPFYFSIFCFLIALRLFTTGERFLIHLFPSISWEIVTKLEYLSFYLAVPVFILFIQSLFPKFSKRILYTVGVLGVAFSLVVLSMPARFFSHINNLYEIITFLMIVYSLYVILISLTEKRMEAFVFLLGFTILSLLTINDILYVEGIIETGHFAPFGMFVFIFSQAFLLTFRFSNALATVESQRRELRDTLESYKHEIVNRIQVEEALRDSHERFLTVLDSIDANVYVADMQTYEVLFMNKHMQDSFGNESIGQTCWKAFRNGPEPCSECTNERLLDAEGKPTGVCVWEGKNPLTGKWYINYDRAINWVNGRFVRLQVATDVTELKQAEEALRESEEKYRTILHSIEDGYYEVDLAGNLTFFNDSLCRILGYSKEELIGVNNRQFMSEETAKQVYETFNRVYRTGKATKAVDWETIRKDGTEKYIETSVSLIRDSEGQPIGFQGVARDITERKKVEEQARLHQQQLMQASKMVALGTLVSGVAHEINNPNNFVMLNSPILKEAWENAMPILEKYYEENGDFILGGMQYTEMRENIPTLFSGISDGAKRIKQIVDDLKNYVRDDTADLTQSVDLNEVLTSAISLVSNMIKKSTNHFDVEYGKNLPLLKGNFQRLEQVAINLIQNACQALTSNNKGIFISTSYDNEKSNVVFRVKDEGTGIPSETLSQITDPFFTTKHDSGGVGLGLSISARIVEEHAGTMHFTSEPGLGTTVEIILPVNRENNTTRGIKND